MTLPRASLAPDYRTWQRDRIVVRGRTYRVATKPGVFAHGRPDPAAVMLAEQLTECTGQVVVSMPSGNGLAGVVAASNGAAKVWMTDRHALGYDASLRSAHDNQLEQIEVALGVGTAPIPSTVFADVVAIRVVPERLVMHRLLRDAWRVLKPGGRCYLAGANDEGAKSASEALGQLFGGSHLLSQHSSHRLVVSTKSALPSAHLDVEESPYADPDRFHEIPVSIAGHTFSLFTRPGVFSWEHLDEASEVLAGLIRIAPGARVLDIGCGAGALGTVASLLEPTASVTMVDADSDAIRCATRTIAAAGLTNARAMLSDIAGAVLAERFDVVVANPPFHVGKQTVLEVPRQFIADAYTVLNHGGNLLIVANRTLPYERVVEEHFGEVRTVHNGRRFKVLSAVKA